MDEMGTQSYDELINELSDICGIVPEYWDIFGEKRSAPLETKKAILQAMRIKVDFREDVIREIEERRWRPWKSFVEPVKVVSVCAQPLTLPVYIPLGEGDERKLSLSWSIDSEDGPSSPHCDKVRREVVRRHAWNDVCVLSGDEIRISEERWIDGVRYIKVNLTDTVQREIGYYRIHVSCTHPAPVFHGGEGRIEKKVRIIVAPDACYIPPELEEGRAWGLGLNLYAIRSGRNWGIGDFGDLRKIARWVAGLGGDFVGINPLHAIPNTRPFGISPYSPVSRLYKNFLYLDLRGVAEVKRSQDAMKIMMSAGFRKEVDALRKAEFIDYDKVAALKGELLRHAFDLFYKSHMKRNTLRGRDFREYLSEEGAPLESFATYMALSEFLNKADSEGKDGKGRRLTGSLHAWQQWPEKYGDPAGEAVKEFRETHEREVFFHVYTQWLIDRQLRRAAEEAKKHGMSVGLYYDLAVGSIGGGNDAWSYQDIVADGADLGAPPDDFNANGQNWGYPPYIHERLKESGYELFIQTMRKNMKYGGALRIDHALGLFRLFWIPGGMSPKEGAYVICPSEDLLRIIALESVRNRTIVIAEDLGTIGENVRETLQRFHMLSYRLFYFERNYPDPSFLQPEKYPEMALCAVTTHDLPTLYGYWAGRDLEVKKGLAIHHDDALWERQVTERERDKRLILSALIDRGLWKGPGFDREGLRCAAPAGPLPLMSPELCLAIYRYLALTPCKLVLVSVDDIIGVLDQQNMPGTIDEHPNWLRKVPSAFEEVVFDGRFADLSEMFRMVIRR